MTAAHVSATGVADATAALSVHGSCQTHYYDTANQNKAGELREEGNSCGHGLHFPGICYQYTRITARQFRRSSGQCSQPVGGAPNGAETCTGKQAHDNSDS